MISKVYKRKNIKYHTMMNRILFSLLIGLLCPFVMAQPGGQHPANHPHPSSNPPMANRSILLTSVNGEEFQVYVDGDIVNKKLMTFVSVQNLTPQYHDVYVVLKRPVDKIAMVQVSPTASVANINVAYNHRTGTLELLLLQSQPQPQPQPQPQVAPVPAPEPPAPRLCTFEEVERMYQTLKRESFDNTRLNMAKQIVSNNHLTASQIKHLTESFSFENAKVQFLQYAYAYCVDPQNYYDCLEALTFSSDKEKVLKFIGK